MQLYYPTKYPINRTNLFGANPAQYKPLGQNGHPGNDFACPMFTPLYAPCDGAAFYVFDSLGGDGIYIRTPDTPAPTHNIILWHMVPPGDPAHPFNIPTKAGVVTDVKAGQLLGYSGNSGYPRESTGPHLHLGVMPINARETALNPLNGYLGCVDPQPFYNGLFAQDIGNTNPVQVVAAVASLVTQVSVAPITAPEKDSLYEKLKVLLSAITALFKGRNNTP